MGATGSCKKIEMKLKWFEMDLYEIGSKVGFFCKFWIIEMKLKWFEMDLYEIGTKVGFFSLFWIN